MRAHMVDLNALAERLRTERERLDMTQKEIAEKVSVERETWNRYEAAKIAPGSKVLLSLVRLGIDIHYVLTGKRMIPIEDSGKATLISAEDTGNYKINPKLTKQELDLILCYRKVSKEGKKSIEDIAKLLASQQ